MMRPQVTIVGLFALVAEFAVGLALVRGVGMRTPLHVLPFATGPLLGVLLFKWRGGNRFVGGAVGGLVTAGGYVLGLRVDRFFRGGQNISLTWMLIVLALILGFSGLLMATVDWLVLRIFSRGPAGSSSTTQTIG